MNLVNKISKHFIITKISIHQTYEINYLTIGTIVISWYVSKTLVFKIILE